MLTIKQQAEISFHHVDVKDAVIMANLMNKLAKCIADKAARELRNKLPENQKLLYNSVYISNVSIDWNEVKSIFDVLSSIGFVATEEYFPEDILAEHIKKD